MLNFINVIFGGALLLAGRKLFWLFVGAIGFAIGVQVALRFFRGSEWMTILIGLGLGIVFAVLAIFMETLAIGIAGFLGGGYILLTLATPFGWDKGILTWIIFIIGGIIGTALVAFLFDWALISISSLAGASMILNAVNFRPGINAVIFFILVIIGVVFQGSALRRDKGQPSAQQNK